MAESKDTKNNTRKTLTLSLKGAGARPTLEKIGGSGSASPSGGRVVVVTKSRNKSPQPHSSTLSPNPSSTISEEDRQRKLALLKNAESSKPVFYNQPPSQNSRISSTARPDNRPAKAIEEAQIHSASSPEAEDTTSTTLEAPSRQQSSGPIFARLDPMDKLYTSGKLRNLDSLGRSRQKKMEEAAAAKVAAEKEAAAKAAASQTNKAAVAPGSTLNNNTRPGGHQRPTGNAFAPHETRKKANTETEEEFAVNRKKEKIDHFNTRRVSISQVLQQSDEDVPEDIYKPRGIRTIKNLGSKKRSKQISKREKLHHDVVIFNGITVQEIANAMAEKAGVVIKELMKLGVMANINQSLDLDTAELVISSLGHKAVIDTESNLEQSIFNKVKQDVNIEDAPLQDRPPIVTIMGHVDHGKTSLLDAYRKTHVVQGEAGGITQHIGAYQVECAGKLITFLDTPGHAAFTAMRLRGAMVTDIVVIIIAADDGIMEQTIEAISHAKAAGVPIIVAINKIDKPSANPERIRNQLLTHNLIPEEMGGDIIVVEVSALANLNLDKLLESILLQAEMLDLKVPVERSAVGSVVEARMDKNRGVIATLLIKKGTLRIGDIVVAGKSFGRVRKLRNDKGVDLHTAPPSTPAEVIAFDTTPMAGDEFIVVGSEKQARDLIEYRIIEESKQQKVQKSYTLESLFGATGAGQKKKLNVLIKADVHGSMEAIAASILKLSTEEVEISVIHQATGGVTESDVTLAKASQAVIVGFNVRASSNAQMMAKTFGIEIRYYSIIYQLIDDIKMAASGLLSPTLREEISGTVEVRDVFDLSKYGKVAGCYVTSGLIKRSSQVRVIRDNIVVHTGEVKALKRFKDDVKEVKSGFECGITLERFEDIKTGDKLEAFDVIEEKRSL